MYLLDHYAAAALTGLLSDGTLRREPEHAARLAYTYALAMIGDIRTEAFEDLAAVTVEEKMDDPD